MAADGPAEGARGRLNIQMMFSKYRISRLSYFNNWALFTWREYPGLNHRRFHIIKRKKILYHVIDIIYRELLPQWLVRSRWLWMLFDCQETYELEQCHRTLRRPGGIFSHDRNSAGKRISREDFKNLWRLVSHAVMFNSSYFLSERHPFTSE